MGKESSLSPSVEVGTCTRQGVLILRCVRTTVIILWFGVACHPAVTSEVTPQSETEKDAWVAQVAVWYTVGDELAFNCTGHYGQKSRIASEDAVLVHVKASNNRSVNSGCQGPDNIPKNQKWIALVRRGDCKFDVKVQTAARANASAVVVYNHRVDDEALVMAHDDYGIVSVMIGKECGEAVANLADDLEHNGTLLHITVVPIDQILQGDGSGDRPENEGNFTRTSVLIVSITFIVLMIFSLAWLVFYYVQRFRFANMKDRITRQLAEAAKRAIKRIPKRSICQADMVENNVCAVCIESYKDNDVVRELPCNHIFHKQCIDHWLIEKRVCPMCKLNILEALGVRVKGVTHSPDAMSASSRDGESGAWDIPMTTLLVSQTPASDPQQAEAEVDASYDESVSLVGDSHAHSQFVNTPSSAELSPLSTHVHQ